MSLIRSEPLDANGEVTGKREVTSKRKGAPMEWDIARAPLPRERLDGVAPAVRILAGVLFLAWSWVSTVLVAGSLFAPVITGNVQGIGYSYLVSFGFAVFVTIAEWVTERFTFVHWPIVLLFDAPFTAWQTHEWLTKIVENQIENMPWWTDIALWIVSIISGIIVAKFGEKLLLSSRRR